jgi:hypothetical protein
LAMTRAAGCDADECRDLACTRFGAFDAKETAVSLANERNYAVKVI